MLFANPLGLLALLGIPTVLAIHFLQRRAKVLPVSTLFLLEKTQRESAVGRRIDRLMNSVPLWMQLLAVLFLTWLLAEPRFQRALSTQRVAVVLDSSASMSVFKDTLSDQLAAELPGLSGMASTLELTLLESGPTARTLYSGTEIEAALAALDDWQPRDGLTDPSRSLRLARSLVSSEGIVVLATDTPVESPPFDARLLAVGEKIDNVGITGVRFGTKEGAEVWTAILRNYSETSATRDWQLELPDGSRTAPREVALAPGALVSIQAAFPRDAPRARLVLSPDRFTLDDSAPLVPPRPKAVTLFAATSPAFEDLAARMTRSLAAIKSVTDASTADLSLVSYDPLDPALPDGNAVVFVDDATRAGAYLKGGIVAEKHPLVAAVNWQALLVRETIQLERLPSDDVLLWQDTRPLIFLREQPGGARQLCFNFDLRLSNATTQPAFIVCLHRFVESIRERKVAPLAANLETGQPVELAAAPEVPVTLETLDLAGEIVTTSELRQPVRFTAPPEPGFIRVRQGESTLLDAALHFADTREADFSAAASEQNLATATATTIDRHTTGDHWWRLWLLILLALLLISWHFSKERPSDNAEPLPSPPISNP